jgi:hypothetical protein
MSEQQISTISSAKDIIFSPSAMQQMSQIAQLMASSVCTVPKHLQGNPGDCFAIALQAAQWGMNPYAVAQKTHIVNGVLGYEAQLVNAIIITNAPVKGRLKYEWIGDWDKYLNGGMQKSHERGLSVKVSGTFIGDTEPKVNITYLEHQMVRNSPLWKTDPRQQLAYLGIKRWSRLHCPDVIQGVYSKDELEEIPSEREINPMPKGEAITSSIDANMSPLDVLLTKIKTMSIADFKTVDITPFTADDKKIIRRAMVNRKAEIEAAQQASVVAEVVAERVVEEKQTDWPRAIKECGDVDTLNALLEGMPEETQIELGDLIDEHFDFLRVTG